MAAEPYDLVTESQTRILPIEYPSAAAFLEAYDPQLASLIAPVVASASGTRPGDKVALSIRVAGHPGRVLVRGAVSPFRPSDGLGLVFKVRPEDSGRLKRAAAFLRGEAQGPREERLPTDDVPVQYLIEGRACAATVRDVSTGGCFLATRGPLPAPRTEIVLEARPPGSVFFKLRLRALVTWVDEVEQSRGFGVRFVADQKKQVERFLFTVLVED